MLKNILNTSLKALAIASVGAFISSGAAFADEHPDGDDPEVQGAVGAAVSREAKLIKDAEDKAAAGQALVGVAQGANDSYQTATETRDARANSAVANRPAAARPAAASAADNRPSHP